MRDTFTREELLEALALRPCHVTGMHTPDHHVESVCTIQLSDGARRVMELLEVETADLPHRLHEANDCGWCWRIPSQEKYRERLRETYRWAGVEIPPELAAPAPDHPCFDISRVRVFIAVVLLSRLGRKWVHFDAMRKGLGLERHSRKMGRPLQALIDSGLVEQTFINHTRHVRLRRRKETE